MKKILSAILFINFVFFVGSAAFAKSSKTAKTQKVKNVSSKKVSTYKSADFYYNNGNDYDMKNNRMGATGEFAKALNVDPDCDKARARKAIFLYFEGKYEEALQDFNYFYAKPGYGAIPFYEYRIDSKVKLGYYPEALDDMYEVIVAYGGHAKLLQDMFNIINANNHLQYKLYPSAHPQVIANYKGQARALRDYAQAYSNSKYNMKNKNFYNFFIVTAKALDPTISMYVNEVN